MHHVRAGIEVTSLTTVIHESSNSIDGCQCVGLDYVRLDYFCLDYGLDYFASIVLLILPKPKVYL